ncbi:rRNA pseudouridine synthase, partial [Candidatus Saccharibacteria bacterium]|nr:rRNA pseudouridine synthase [Candidatus Saccharibacteria bacterium]
TSRFDDIVPLSDHKYRISLHEGRNHQIRRTLGALNYTVYSLKRTEHGPYRLDTMKPGEWREV